jgi:hypothetical protein
VWDRRNGSILDRAHRAFYSGKAGTASMIDALAAVGTRMDPVVRQIVTRQNPIRVMLGPRIRVKTVGSVKTQGVPTDLMEFKSGRGVVLMAIRKDNGLLASVHTTLQDARGAVVSDSLKNYLYSSVGKPVSVSTFSLAATRGYKMGSITSLSK